MDSGEEKENFLKISWNPNHQKISQQIFSSQKRIFFRKYEFFSLKNGYYFSEYFVIGQRSMLITIHNSRYCRKLYLLQQKTVYLLQIFDFFFFVRRYLFVINLWILPRDRRIFVFFSWFFRSCKIFKIEHYFLFWICEPFFFTQFWELR